MWPDRVSNPGPPTYESGALPTARPGNFRTYINHKSHHLNTLHNRHGSIGFTARLSKENSFAVYIIIRFSCFAP